MSEKHKKIKQNESLIYSLANISNIINASSGQVLCYHIQRAGVNSAMCKLREKSSMLASKHFAIACCGESFIIFRHLLPDVYFLNLNFILIWY